MSNIKQIAEMAGVSTCTVSRYLNHKIIVSNETEERIKKAISTLNYVPSSAARSLKTSETKTIALLLPKINNLYFPDITAGISSVLNAEGYTLAMYEAPETDGVLNEEYCRRIYASRCDGVIVLGYQSYNTETMRFQVFERAGIPVVWANKGAESSSVPLVYPNYVQCGEIVADYIYSRGKRNPCIISVLPSGEEQYTLVDSFAKSFSRVRGMQWTPDVMVMLDKQPTYTEQVLNRIQKHNLDCLFVTDEMTSVYLIKELGIRGIRVPQDVGIIGFGNTFLGKIVTPTLTCLDLNNYILGEVSAQVLLKHMRCKIVPAQTLVEPLLLRRESL